jgi:ABC-type molybdate transport system substrate-binding protein
VKAATLATLLAAALNTAQAQTTAPVAVYAAGSLRAALTEVSAGFERIRGVPVRLTFGASGLLRDRIAGGEPAQVFASANMDHPQALASAGKAEPVQAFARNALCVLATPGFSLQGKTLPQRLLDSDVKLGTSTPRADPSGDYAFEMFDRIEATGAAGPGSAAVLKTRALQLTGGPNSPAPPANRSVYGELVAAGQADAFVTYCTNAAQARREHPQLQVMPVPDAVNVAARYGVALLQPAGVAARDWVAYLLSPAGQAVLASHGFSAP